MSLRKKMLAVCLAGVMVIAISACGPSKTVNQTPKKTVEAAVEKINKAKSISTTMSFDAKMVMGEAEAVATATADADIVYDPIAVQIIVNSTAEGQEEEQTKDFAKEENGEIVSYTAYGDQWAKRSIDKQKLMELIRMYDTKENISLLLEKVSDIKELSRENKIVTFEVTVKESDFQAVAEQTQLFKTLGFSGLPAEYFKGIGDFKMTLDIDELTGLPKAYHMDLSAQAQTIMDNVNNSLAGAAEEDTTTETPSIGVERYIVDVVINNIDKIEKITVPQEAIDNAVDVPEQMKLNEQAPTENAATNETPTAE